MDARGHKCDLISYARYSDGSEPGSRPSVSKLTLKQLNKYDYGIKWGDKYKGTKVLTLEQMAAWIAKHPDTELYIEVKTSKMTATQIKKAKGANNDVFMWCWEKTSKGWKYKLASGDYASSRWMTISGKKYYFNKNGVMRTGWLGEGGKLYYFDSNGVMATGKKTINKHVFQFGADGALIKKIK